MKYSIHYWLLIRWLTIFITDLCLKWVELHFCIWAFSLRHSPLFTLMMTNRKKSFLFHLNLFYYSSVLASFRSSKVSVFCSFMCCFQSVPSSSSSFAFNGMPRRNRTIQATEWVIWKGIKCADLTTGITAAMMIRPQSIVVRKI